jgi:hypothetical protein
MYCEYLDYFADAAAVRTCERLARISANDYIESLEKEYERTKQNQADRQRVQLERLCGSDWVGTVPDVAFIAMRKQEDKKKKITALFALEQQKSSNYRNWLIRFTTGDPSGIAPRHAESVDPWTERYKLFAWLHNRHHMRLYLEQRYNQREFWYFSTKGPAAAESTQSTKGPQAEASPGIRSQRRDGAGPISGGARGGQSAEDAARAAWLSNNAGGPGQWRSLKGQGFDI